MPNKNVSRKNKQVKKPMAVETKGETVETTEKKVVESNEDDWAVNILMKNTTNVTRKKKPVKEPEPVVIPPVPEWEQVGMKEEEYKAMRERVAKQMAEWQVENMKAFLEAELDSVAYWESRLETLERCRERYNKKAAWSAADIDAVDEIDAEMAECEENIDRLEGEDWVEDGYADRAGNAISMEAY
jgi:hypothetical protein